MNLKKVATGVLLGASLVGGCNEETSPSGKELTQQVDTSRVQAESVHEILENLQNRPGAISNHGLKAEVAEMNISQLQKDSLVEEINRMPNDDLHVIPMERVRKGPLGKMRNINHSLATLLGGKYADSIMLQYNKELIDTLEAPGSWTQMQYTDLPDINAPHVYPALADFLVPSLKDFLADKPEIKSLVGEESEVVIITRNEAKKHVIGYYRDGHIDIGQYISAGVGRDFLERDNKLKRKRKVHAYTKEGIFYTNYNVERGMRADKRDSTYRSGTFGASKKGKHADAPMPYAVPIDDDKYQDGVFFHTGYADGTPRSHECNRLPGWLAMYMYDIIGDRKVKVVIHNMYDPKVSPDKKK